VTFLDYQSIRLTGKCALPVKPGLSFAFLSRRRMAAVEHFNALVARQVGVVADAAWTSRIDHPPPPPKEPHRLSPRLFMGIILWSLVNGKRTVILNPNDGSLP
jgi:hypothetical protein